MPQVDLAGQGDGAATGGAGVALNLALAGQGGGAASGAAGAALLLSVAGAANAAGAGPSQLAVTLDLRNRSRPGHFFTGLAQAAASATGTLTQIPSPLSVTLTLQAFSRAQGGAQGHLSASLTLLARAAGKGVAPSAHLAGVRALQARCVAQSSAYARAVRHRLLHAQGGGQASGAAALATG